MSYRDLNNIINECENVNDDEKITKILDKITSKDKKKDLLYAFLVIALILSVTYSVVYKNNIPIIFIFGIISIYLIVEYIINIKRKIKYKFDFFNIDKTEIEHLLALYKEKYSDNKNNILKKRSALRLMYFFIIVEIIALIPFFIFIIPRILFRNNTELLLLILGGCSLIVNIFFAVMIPLKKEEYFKIIKKEIVEKFINYYGEYKYNESPKLHNYEIVYRNLKFDTKLYDIFEFEDYIYGKIKEKYFFEMFDLCTYYNIDSKRTKFKDWKLERFEGSFTILDMNKQFSHVKIIKNKINIFDRNDLLYINNEKFNKYFEIHAEDKESVKEFLTPQLIQFIVDFREKYKIDFEIIFKDKIYIRFFTGNMFEPKIFGKLVDKISIYKYYVITKFAKELVEKLDNM